MNKLFNINYILGVNWFAFLQSDLGPVNADKFPTIHLFISILGNIYFEDKEMPVDNNLNSLINSYVANDSKIDKKEMKDIISKAAENGISLADKNEIEKNTSYMDGDSRQIWADTKNDKFKTTTIGAVGDILPHGSVKKSAQANAQTQGNSGFDSLYGPGVKANLAFVDIAFANLETPIAPETSDPYESVSFKFNAPMDFLNALKDLGVDVVSFANNHVFDQGKKGFVNTLDNLKKNDMKFVGAGTNLEEANKPVYFELKDKNTKVAFIGATDILNVDLNKENEAYVNKADINNLKKSIAEAKKNSDSVIISVHWGNEYHREPSSRQKEMAKQLIEAGADIILGHHPHILQPMEEYTAKDGRKAVIIYSMGNFVSNQDYGFKEGTIVDPDKKFTLEERQSQGNVTGYKRDGVVFKASITKAVDTGETEVSDFKYEQTWTKNELSTTKSGSASRHIETVVIDDEIAKLQKQLEQGQGNEKEIKEKIKILENRKDITNKLFEKTIDHEQKTGSNKL